MSNELPNNREVIGSKTSASKQKNKKKNYYNVTNDEKPWIVLIPRFFGGVCSKNGCL